MSVVRSAVLLLAATLLATSAHADPFRFSAKMSCFQPSPTIHGTSVSLRKTTVATSALIAEVLAISDAEAKELDLVYDAGDRKLSIVKRCDGTVVEQLMHSGGFTNAVSGPVGQSQRVAETVLLVPDSPWGVFGTTGAAGCRFFQKVQTFQVTAVAGVCKGAIRTVGGECDAQFAPIGKFTPGPGCM